MSKKKPVAGKDYSKSNPNHKYPHSKEKLTKQALYWEGKLKEPGISDNEKKRYGRFLGEILKKKREI